MIGRPPTCARIRRRRRRGDGRRPRAQPVRRAAPDARRDAADHRDRRRRPAGVRGHAPRTWASRRRSGSPRSSPRASATGGSGSPWTRRQRSARSGVPGHGWWGGFVDRFEELSRSATGRVRRARPARRGRGLRAGGDGSSACPLEPGRGPRHGVGRRVATNLALDRSASSSGSAVTGRAGAHRRPSRRNRHDLVPRFARCRPPARGRRAALHRRPVRARHGAGDVVRRRHRQERRRPRVGTPAHDPRSGLGTGAAMNFDDLHDPQPPRPGRRTWPPSPAARRQLRRRRGVGRDRRGCRADRGRRAHRPRGDRQRRRRRRASCAASTPTTATAPVTGTVHADDRTPVSTVVASAILGQRPRRRDRGDLSTRLVPRRRRPQRPTRRGRANHRRQRRRHARTGRACSSARAASPSPGRGSRSTRSGSRSPTSASARPRTVAGRDPAGLGRRLGAITVTDLDGIVLASADLSTSPGCRAAGERHVAGRRDAGGRRAAPAGRGNEFRLYAVDAGLTGACGRGQRHRHRPRSDVAPPRRRRRRRLDPRVPAPVAARSPTVSRPTTRHAGPRPAPTSSSRVPGVDAWYDGGR